MIHERDCVYEVEIEVSHLNEHHILKPHAYQILFSKIAERHLTANHLSVEDTMKHGLAWALISLNIEIKKPVTGGCQTLYATTWHSGRRGPFFRRELLFKNKAGETVFCGSTFSVLLDMEKRSVYRSRTLPFPLGDMDPTFTMEATPTMKTQLPFSPFEIRPVYPSYIDCLGHVNNCRYGEFAYDALTTEERERLPSIRRMEIYFISELRPSDTFTVQKAYEEGKVYVRGHNDVKKDTAFDVVLYF